MRVLKNNAFARFASKNGISDDDLCEAVQRSSQGSVDANLGGGVIKPRVAREGQGKSAGFRCLIVFQRGERAIFVHGFAKNDIGNIDARELKALKKLAKVMLKYDERIHCEVIESGSVS
jgi:hypothetical protein